MSSILPSSWAAQTKQEGRYLHTSKRTFDDDQKKFKWPRMTMSEEQKKSKTKKIEEMQMEEPPKSMFAKVKYYFKRYWYIAVPSHVVSCSAWFAALYLIVRSGVDVIAILEWLHMPEAIVEKVRSTPPTAGVVVVSLILYKLATPFRYATTLLLIQASFWSLRRMGKLKTAREVEYKVRTEYELNKSLYGRRMYRYRHLGVRSVARKNSTHASTTTQSQVHRLQKDHEHLNREKKD